MWRPSQTRAGLAELQRTVKAATDGFHCLQSEYEARMWWLKMGTGTVVAVEQHPELLLP